MKERPQRKVQKMSKLDFVESFQHENIFDHIGIRNTAVVYDFCVTDYVTVKIMFPKKMLKKWTKIWLIRCRN